MLVLAVNRTVKVNIKLNINLVALKNILGQHQLAGSSTGCFFLFLRLQQQLDDKNFPNTEISLLSLPKDG